MLKKSSVQTQFFLSYILIAFICIFTFSIFFYNYVSDILIERQTDSLLSMTDNFLINIDAAISTMEDVSLNFEYNQQLVPNCFPFVESEFSPTTMLSDLKAAYLSVNGIDYKVVQMNAYDLEGNKLSVGSYLMQDKVDLTHLDWVEPTTSQQGKKYIGLPYESSDVSLAISIPMNYISLYHALYDSFGRHVGYIESVQTSKKIFKNIISYENSDFPVDTTQVYVFNQDGTLMFPYENVSDETLSLCQFYFDSTDESYNYLHISNPLTNEKELMTYETSSYSNFTFVCIQDESIILAPIYTFTRILGILIIIILCVVFYSSYMMSKNLTKPIHQLLEAFYSTQIDTLGIEKQLDIDSSFNEFDRLNDAYYSMSTKLKDSMNILLETQEQELKSRNLALQSQMNPHFYYNSLSSIMVLAENNQTSDIIHFARNLTSMMRYITAGSMQVVTLDSEISYLEKYLYCMKIRYQSSLNYSIDIDSSLHKISILKLLLQPLIENAIKYGTECDPPWSVRVYSEITDTQWFIHVVDSGPGFSEEALIKLQNQIETADSSIGIPDMHIDGMGLLNVYLRWTLFHSKNVFYFGNNETGGGYVTIGGDITQNQTQ
ncbi:MAG: histidine kinase [Eubacteriales bacterium]